MSKISKIIIEQVFDGSGGLAINLELMTDRGNFCRACLPMIRKNENGPNLNYSLIQESLNKFFINLDVDDGLWEQVIKFLSNERNKKNLSAPIPLLIEIAVIKIMASVQRIDVFEQINTTLGIEEKLFFIPTPLITLFNGGGYGDTNLDFEEYLLIPLTKNKTTFEQKIINANQVYKKLGTVLKTAGYDTDTGVMGGYAPDLVSTVEALDLIVASINLAGFGPANDFGLGIDVGSANLYNPEEHNYLFRLSHNYFNTTNLSHLYQEWLSRYPLFYLEDCLAPDDLIGWQNLSEELRDDIVLAGDKLFSNDISILRRGLKARLANTAVIKMNEFASLIDLVDFVKLAKKHNYQIVISSGDAETNDAFVADLSVATGADFVKFGSMSRGERIAKYNRLLSLSRRLENFF